ncbi:hypothetical protein Btru_072989 [Bulinus truncatus]|nr:hypothetical protein Btru_072989 [Bulinus truncatus]
MVMAKCIRKPAVEPPRPEKNRPPKDHLEKVLRAGDEKLQTDIEGIEKGPPKTECSREWLQRSFASQEVQTYFVTGAKLKSFISAK